MKCKDCSCCHKGWFDHRPNDYVCTGVRHPFVISNIENECTEYADKRSTNTPIPCPFCGGKSVLQNWELNYYEKCNIDTDSDYWWSVFCEDCFCEGPSGFSKEEAIVAWNRRF